MQLPGPLCPRVEQQAAAAAMGKVQPRYEQEQGTRACRAFKYKISKLAFVTMANWPENNGTDLA